MKELTPREIVTALDRHIIGQARAKQAIAIAIRNRWRRRQLPADMAREVYPKNIIMIGSTGVGKTEIARRMADLVDAPFVKVEATKFTEVGYHGGDVSSIIRSLIKTAVNTLETREKERVAEQARANAVERVLDILVPPRPRASVPAGETAAEVPDIPDDESSRENMRTNLIKGTLDRREIEIDVERPVMPMIEVLSNQGMEDMGMELQSLFENMGPRGRSRKRVKTGDALRIFTAEEAEKLIRKEEVIKEALEMTENAGIVFIDEIDKIARREDAHRDIDVSREGVQRDLLPLVEGTTIATRYGNIRTDYILFIAAGAFHRTKPADLMPELQGRFPIRVELDDLKKDDFVRILKEPDNALTRQYSALLQTEEVTLTFTDDAIDRLADIAVRINAGTVNIGARRLYTIIEKLLEDVSFHAPEMRGTLVTVDAGMVDDRLKGIAEDEDLSKYIL